MTRPLLLIPVLACAVLLSGCLAGKVVGGVASATVKTTGAVASALIPGESRKQRLERLDREDKARRKAEKAARKAEDRRRREEGRD